MIQLDNAVERYKKIILDDLAEANIRCWIAGGALRDYFMGEIIKTDYDIFFSDKENYDRCASWFKQEDKKSKVVWESDNGMKVRYNKRTYDLIKLFFPGPQETIDSFDFTVCQFAVDREKMYYGETSFIDLAKRQLMIHHITLPASTLNRTLKYYKKGFWMCQGELKKLFEAIQNWPKEEKKENEVVETNSNDTTVTPSSGENGFFRGYD